MVYLQGKDTGQNISQGKGHIGHSPDGSKSAASIVLRPFYPPGREVCQPWTLALVFRVLLGLSSVGLRGWQLVHMVDLGLQGDWHPVIQRPYPNSRRWGLAPT